MSAIEKNARVEMIDQYRRRLAGDRGTVLRAGRITLVQFDERDLLDGARIEQIPVAVLRTVPAEPIEST